MKMQVTRFVAGTAFALFVVALVQPLQAATLPSVSPPAGFAMTAGPEGGRVLTGSISAPSAERAFAAGIRATRGYFDERLRFLGGVTSKDGRVTVAIFDGKLERLPVRGLVMTTYTRGTTSVSYLFDEPQRLASTLPGMEQALSAAPAGGASSLADTARTPLEARWMAAAHRAAGVPLTPLTFPDRSAGIGVASGFTPHPTGIGTFNAQAGDKAFLRIKGSFEMHDPSAGANVMQVISLPYSDDLRADWLAARKATLAANNLTPEDMTIDDVHELEPQPGTSRDEVFFGTADEFGERMAYMAVVSLTPPQRGLWSMTFTILWSPPDRIETDVPKLFAMVASYQPNVDVQSEEVSQFNAAIREREQAFTRTMLASNAAARDAQRRRFDDSMRESAAGRKWISQQGVAAVTQYQGKVRVYANGDSGNQIAVPISQSDGFVPVPTSKLAVDY